MPASRQYLVAHNTDPKLRAYETDFNAAHAQTRGQLEAWLNARHGGNQTGANAAFAAAAAAQQQGEKIRVAANAELSAGTSGATANDADYVFITFILQQLPHGVIGLLVAAFFAAALSSKAAELNALGSSTTIDFYRHLIKRDATDANCVVASKCFTAFWGLIAIGFALYAHLVENLIQAVNILGSIFYGVMLGLFVVAFFVRRVGGTAVFWAALAAQTLVFFLYFNLTISYLWYPLIGCAACVLFSVIAAGRFGRWRQNQPEHASGMKSPIICFGQQPCGFFPKRFLFAKIQTARRLQKEIGGEIVFFLHDSDHDPRETKTILRHRKTNEPAHLNFAFENKIQRKFSPLHLKRIPAGWQNKTALQLPNYVGHPLIDLFKSVSAANVADFCLELYRQMGLLDGIRVVRSSDPGFRRAACDVSEFFVEVPHAGEIVRARLVDGALKLHAGGDSFVTLP
jgi:hypothetical protein